MGGGKLAGRSLSATAVPPPLVNGQGKMRKGVSAHATLQNGAGRSGVVERTGEEEDLPLALWQQQRRK
jgi:hypothetical protein